MCRIPKPGKDQVRLHIPAQVGDRLTEELLLSAGEQAVVKLPVEAHPVLRRNLGRVHRVEYDTNPICRLRGHPQRSPFGGKPLQAHPDFVHLLQFAAIEFGDTGPALWIDDHETFGGEPMERLADRDGTTIEVVGKFLLRQPLPGLIDARDDPFAKLSQDCCLKGLCS
jgi:hypothetical protein